MTLVEERPSLQLENDRLAADALLEEAHQRGRRRRTAGVIGALVIGGVLAGVFAFGGNSGGRHGGGETITGGGMAMPLAAQPFAKIAINATAQTKFAALAFSFGHGAATSCNSGSSVPVTNGLGIVNFVKGNDEFSELTENCRTGVHLGTTSYRELGGTVYVEPPTPLGNSSKPWYAAKSKPYSIPFGTYALFDYLTSPLAVHALDGLQGRIERVGNFAVNGVATTEYKGSMTLTSLYGAMAPGTPTTKLSTTVSGYLNRPLVPSSNAIKVSIQVWIDKKGRVSRLRINEPLFTGVYTDGSDEQDAPQVTATNTEGIAHSITWSNGTVTKATPIKHLPLRRLRQQGNAIITVNYSNFGHSAVIEAPPATATQFGRR